jgi:iron complex transport system substrate-binding protein
VNRTWLFIAFATIVCFSCSNAKDSNSLSDNLDANPTKHAKGFSIATIPNGHIVSVFNPWQGAKDITYSYALTESDHNLVPQNVNEAISVPVSRIVCLSTTHIAFIDYLNKTDLVIGISGANYVSNPSLRERVKNGMVKDVGYEQALNYELIVSLKPEVVFSYGVGAEMAGYVQKFNDLKIPVVFIGDYLEESPLGKAEWLKVFGLFVGKSIEADSLFNIIEEDYLNTKQLVSDVTSRPTVFLNTPWKDVWYFPGNKGYMATLINDAGGDYILSRLQGNQSHPFSLEAAIEQGINADIWINTGSSASIKEITDVVPMVRRFSSITNGKVFNNNLRLNEFGGNDFWESGVVNPHLVLRDLVKIFHPDSIQHKMVYYQQLN